ncbi:Orn/Lys/Arg decarboxylase [Alcanivorax sp. 521-1]|uniref:Orn/Lys/Arg decarboxylase n=1 Tax=Alloalcanivorax profundimaris TaxID=2735259 RepID=A0ABS0AMF4_9GAMM|nr:Orn/Lys/Arg decarboxylase N-terminal domain-containing protein [Alloalcanivorax profundimaris]MBF5055104.1 Orn/Lys/Arg decarboxylase [Alloalcanivorax profundimaris]
MPSPVERPPLGILILIASPNIHADNAVGHTIATLIEDLERRDVTVVTAGNSDDAVAMLASEPAIQCVLTSWRLPGTHTAHGALEVLSELRARSAEVPAFLLASRETAKTIPMRAMEMASDFIWLLEDTPSFIGGRILAAVERYRRNVLPPMFDALVRFSRVHEYSWHTPGHHGGAAFLKAPAGRAFFEFYGENMLRSDLSISVAEMGSLLDHSGPIGAGERYAARVFGADRTYYVTNGSSTSNRVILMASATRDQVVLCDRNCHKSVEHAITLSGAVPSYLVPIRNHYGLIGPIPPERLTASAIRDGIATSPLCAGLEDSDPVHAVITNSTYDGLCYKVSRVEELLGDSVDRLHFDEAWYGYARFNPIYRERYAMHGEPGEDRGDKPTLFATQSTHKLLAALSQASMIHIREGRRPIEHNRFNEAFMMHASTSPQYSIIASNDVSAAMMDGPGGERLTGDAIREAVAFRQVMARLIAEYDEKGEWFFGVWQPETAVDPMSKERVPFHEAPLELLASTPQCWTLNPGDRWHGFKDLEADYCMLDPVKVSITTPGMGFDGKLKADGIPAAVVSAYLDERGIVVEKTTDFTILFLFSIGITKGKWGTLINALMACKRDFDANAPLHRCMPGFADRHGLDPDQGLRTLARSMFDAMAALRTTALMGESFSALPTPDLSPVRAYEKLVQGQVEQLPLSALAGRTLATGVVPYPPGIPLLMPGENAGPADGPVLGYLNALQEFDRRFPGFEHDNHGVEVIDGTYHLYCVKQD